MMEKTNLDIAIYKMGAAKKFVGPKSSQTMKKLEKYLDTPVATDANGNRRFTKRQLKKMKQVWLARNPEQGMGEE